MDTIAELAFAVLDDFSEIRENSQAPTATSSALVAGLAAAQQTSTVPPTRPLCRLILRKETGNGAELRRELNRFVNLNHAIRGCITQEALDGSPRSSWIVRPVLIDM